LDAVKGYLIGKDPFDVNRHMALCMPAVGKAA
jgi:hypothetical protein